MDENNETLKLFSEVANAISGNHLATVKMLALTKGMRPGYEDLMPVLQQLHEELTQKAVEFISIIKKQDITLADMYTTELGVIIKKTIEDFIKQL